MAAYMNLLMGSSVLFHGSDAINEGLAPVHDSRIQSRLIRLSAGDTTTAATATPASDGKEEILKDLQDIWANYAGAHGGSAAPCKCNPDHPILGAVRKAHRLPILCSTDSSTPCVAGGLGHPHMPFVCSTDPSEPCAASKQRGLGVPHMPFVCSTDPSEPCEASNQLGAAPDVETCWWCPAPTLGSSDHGGLGDIPGVRFRTAPTLGSSGGLGDIPGVRFRTEGAADAHDWPAWPQLGSSDDEGGHDQPCRLSAPKCDPDLECKHWGMESYVCLYPWEQESLGSSDHGGGLGDQCGPGFPACDQGFKCNRIGGTDKSICDYAPPKVGAYLPVMETRSNVQLGSSDDLGGAYGEPCRMGAPKCDTGLECVSEPNHPSTCYKRLGSNVGGKIGLFGAKPAWDRATAPSLGSSSSHDGGEVGKWIPAGATAPSYGKWIPAGATAPSYGKWIPAGLGSSGHEGGEGEPCRWDEPECDRGLKCVPAPTSPSTGFDPGQCVPQESLGMPWYLADEKAAPAPAPLGGILPIWPY